MFKQILVLRKDLNMRKGKMIAQGAHASLAAILAHSQEGEEPSLIKDTRVQAWLSGKFTKIAVSVDSEAELLAVHDLAQKNGFLCSLIQDSGLTEFNGVPTYTAVAVGPALAEDLHPITGHLKLL